MDSKGELQRLTCVLEQKVTLVYVPSAPTSKQIAVDWSSSYQTSHDMQVLTGHQVLTAY